MPDKLDELIKEAEAEVARAKALNDEREIKLQRMNLPPAHLPSGPAYDPRERTLDLSDDREKAFLDYVRTGQESKALVADTVGGYLISPAIERELSRSLEKEVVIRRLATTKTMTKNRLEIRSISEAQAAFGVLETGSDITESTPTPGVPTYQYVEEINGLVKVGIDELEDSDHDLAEFLINSFSRAIAELEELKFLKGAGHSSGEPDGITLDATLIANTVTTDTAGAITVDDMLDLMYACPAQYRKNGTFLVNSLTELALRKLRFKTGVTEEGGYLWLPAVSEALPNTMLGKPIYCVDDMETLAGAEQVVAIFGNFKRGYRILDRVEFSLQRLTEIYSEANLIGFKIRKRTGGGLINPSRKALVLLTEHA